MITGNITLSRRPKEDDLRSDVICSSCLSACDEVPVDDSFDDQFGNVTCWGVGSSCCGAETFKGRIFFHKSTIHTARKDHAKGNIKAGQKYRAIVEKGYYVGDDGKHNGIFNYTKKLVKPKTPV